MQKTGSRPTGDRAAAVFKVALIAAGLVGQLSQGNTENFMSASRWLYYTNLSNVAVMAVAAALLCCDVRSIVSRGASADIPDWLQAVRFTVTVGIALTFLVFSLLLTPEMLRTGHADYLTSLNNLCVHNFVPLLAILDFCLFAGPCRTGKRTLLLGTIMPLLYVIFVYAGGALGLTFGKGKRVPYFFFDYEANGWFALGGGRIGTAWWLLLLLLAILGMGAGLSALANAAAKRRTCAASLAENVKRP